MNRKLVFILLLIVALAFGEVRPGHAQEDAEATTSYVIQVGDTLSSIATRFGIGLDLLISENNISDPNNVFVGTSLLLPGVDWIEGELDVVPVTLGTTFLGLQRQYQLGDVTLARALGISSPSQLFVDYPALLPVDQVIYQDVGRTTLGENSMFETAAANGINPWTLMAANQVNNPWEVVSEDVLLLPGVEGSGPNGLPYPVSGVDVTHGNFVQGKTTVIEIQAGGLPITLGGELLGQPLNFVQKEDGDYAVLQGVHAMTAPGYYPITLTGVLEDGTSFGFSQMIEVVAGGYGFETITVDAALLDPELDKTELDFIREITSPATSQKYWAQIFVSPTEFDDFITSFFGTRRSYNGGPYNLYHTGVDFGGGKGVEITAPAPGQVMFAGPLEIRGNATIVDHGWGVYTGYWHQDEIKVAVGDVVTTGQAIGIVGNTGRSSGAHLHWEMWVGGVQVAPLDWLQFFYP